MPIYEYRCDKGHSFDVLQSMSDDPLTACQVCDAPVQKVLHAPAVHFKGSGFYTTDYGKKGAANSGGDSKKDKAESNGSSGGSGSKPDSGSSADSGSSSSGSGSDAGKKPESKTGASSKSD